MALAFLNFTKKSYIKFVFARTIMSTNINLKEAEKELEKNPYWAKYQEKIQQVRKLHPEEYWSKIRAKQEADRAVREKKKKDLKYPEPRVSDTSGKGGSVRKGLNDILKLDLIEGKTAEEIKTIWNGYHKGKDIIYSTFNNEQFNHLSKNFTSYPIFVLPLPRGDGYELFLLQHAQNELHFTPLSLYKKYGENSPECLCVTYYPELRDKDIILMRGEFDKDVLTALECQCLINIVHMFYNDESNVRTNMIKMFNKKPDEFKFNEIISEVEKLGYIDMKPK